VPANVSHEIVMVDDGSDDNTARRVEKMCKARPHLRLLRQQVNMGAGPARNRGLEECRGEFIWFVDADDEIPPAAFSGLDVARATDGCDVLIFRYNRVLPRSRKIFPWIEYDARVFAARPGNDFTAVEFPAVLTSSHAVWNNWFHRENTAAADMIFPDTPAGTEDLSFTVANLYAARRLRFLDRELYTLREDSSRLSRITDRRRLAVLTTCDFTED
jgi:glycosyltransferase involved in cell wall biosynthesis